MGSKLIMTNNNHKQNDVRNVVDRVKVRVPRISKQNSDFVYDCKINAEFLIQNYSNFNRSAVPERFMCYEDGLWVDLEGDALELVRSNFMERKAVAEVLLGGFRWLMDFYRMLMVNFDCEDEKSIAWIDVQGKCFFPSRFVSGRGMVNRDTGICNFAGNLCDDVPKIEIEIEIEIKVSENLNKLSRENVELESEGEITPNDQLTESKKRKLDLLGGESPELRKKKLFLSDCESPRWPKTKLLKEEDKAYQYVKKLFLTGSGLEGAMITGIHKYARPGPLDKARNEVFQKQIEITKTARGGEANSTFAWHGTSAKGVESILSYGFGMPSKVPDSEAHGVGIYLSPVRTPHFGTMLSEVDDNGERHAILCRIILGKCEKVAAGSQQSYPSSVNFDTGVDDLAQPKWYIVWGANMNTHLLPECVVSYKLSNEVPGRFVSPISRLMQNVSTPSSTLLLSRLKERLPSSKVQELRTLCGGYKDGKLPRDIFMKQLRSVVGDEKLLSVVREIRG